jgi:hypothetical protein
MSKKKIELTHWTPKEEEQIRERLAKIKEASGNYILSTKSDAYKELESLMPNRSAQALNIKVRTMMSETFKPQIKRTSASIDQVADKVLREVYGTVSYDTFMQIKDRVTQR